MPRVGYHIRRIARSLGTAAAGLAVLFSGCSLWKANQNSELLTRSRQLSLQGMEADAAGKHQAAEQCYAAAIQACPNDDRARCRYSESLWRRGAKNEAVAHMEEAVRLSSQAPERIVQLGRMQLEMADPDSAQLQVTRALARDKELASAWVLKAELARHEGRLEDALAFYHRALGLTGCPPEVSLHVADLYARLDRPQRALATLQTAADQHPPGQVPPGILHRQGLACRALGRYEDSVGFLASAAGREPPTADLLCDLAMSQYLAGDAASARLAASAALDRNPQHDGARRLIGDMEARQAALSASAGTIR